MKKFDIKKFAIVTLLVAIALTSVLAMLFGAKKTYSAYANVYVPDGDDVTVYVSGNDVKKSEDGKNYVVNVNSTVTVTVINEKKLFKSMTIGDANGSTTYVEPVAEVTVPESGELKITVETEQPYADDLGKYFGNPYTLTKEAEVLALGRILARTATEEDFGLLGAEGKTAEEISHAYFRLGTNLFIGSDEFFGLGFRGGYPFSGCFDFNGYTATINLVRTEYRDEEFSSLTSGTTTYNVADYGFFGFAYGKDLKPCLIRNAKVQGFIALNTMNADQTVIGKAHVNAGGIAGTIGKNVVFDGLESSVSVSAQTRYADLYLGGMFGLCSSSVDNWCKAEYDGEFNDISGVTYGTGSHAMVGCFAGVIQNASVDGLLIDGHRALLLANSLGEVSGSAIAGGLAGVIEIGSAHQDGLSSPRSIVIRNVTILAENDYSVTAVINNSGSTKKNQIDPDNFMESSSGAVAGGIVGTVNRDATITDSSIKAEFSDIYFRRDTSVKDESSGSGRLFVRASTQDAFSSGAVYAGGAVGFIYSDGADYITRSFPDASKTEYIFECPVDISATQNGVGPAYAGGVFGYNCFNFESAQGDELKIAVTDPKYDYSVTATQSTSSTSVNGSDGKNVFYNVCAGGYTSRLNIGYTIGKGTFYINNGHISAYREVGSTAVGDVNAGGFAGRLLSCKSAIKSLESYVSSPSQSGSIKNLTVYHSDNSHVEAACYSFSSINNGKDNVLGNNVCAGGAIGYIVGYKEINNVSVKYDSTTPNVGASAAYFVYGAQNATNKIDDKDLKSEGFVGGLFGLTVDTYITDVSIIGSKAENAIVYFESANSPNTASVGGLIGAYWKQSVSAALTLSGATVQNVHVAGKAYSEKQTGDDTYDLYVGGAIGVLANAGSYSTNMKNIKVDNCVVDAIGEKQMLTYAGGIAAGIWWASSTSIDTATVTNSSITASSITAKAYAGGVAGLMQNANANACAVIDTEVKATSEQNSAYSAGIAARLKTSCPISSAYSNAFLTVKGGSNSSAVKSGIVAEGTMGTATNNYFVSENAGVPYSVGKNGTTGGGAIHLVSFGVNELTLATNTETETVYTSYTSGNITFASSDESIVKIGATTSGVTEITAQGKSGVAYISAYVEINGNKHLLCSYPVTVVEVVEDEDFSLNVTDEKGGKVTEANSDGFVVKNGGTENSPIEYVYFRRNIGNSKTVKEIVVKGTTKYLPKNLKFYDLSGVLGVNAAYFDEKSDVSEQALARLDALIGAKSGLTACAISAFNGKANVSYVYDGSGADGDARIAISYYANDNVRDNTIVWTECSYNGKTYVLVVEFVPNKLQSISIKPEDGTPPLAVRTGDDGLTRYVYSPGDVVRFKASLEYRYKAPLSYIVETVYEGTGVTENGTVVVESGKTYNVTCHDLKNNVTTTVVVESENEIDFNFAYSGADGSSDRKMIENCDFDFSIAPQPGYGLVPTIKITVNGNTIEGIFSENSKIAFKIDDEIFYLEYNVSSDYSYDIVVPAEFISKFNGAVEFSISYDKVYSIVFMPNYGTDGALHFEKKVASGVKFSDIDLTGLDGWTDARKKERYGYDFRGYYTVYQAGDKSAYGKSFDDMRGDGVSVVSGTMHFYARWTYNVTIEAPEGIEVTSSMTSSVLHDGIMIPVDSYVGFGFVMTTGKLWQGIPRFDAYILNEDGSFEKITEFFGEASQENGYFVSADVIAKYKSGHIYIKVYADSLEFAVGDDPIYDGNAIYTDGIYTLTYNVNYGLEDTLSDVKFGFDREMPTGTTARTFYVKDGVTIWSGDYRFYEAASEISVSSFTSMKDGSTFTSAKRSGATSEKFILVITLPNNSNSFEINEATEVKVTVKAYAYNAEVESYGEVAPKVKDSATAEDDETKFVLYPAVIRSVTVDDVNKTLTFVEDGTAVSEVVDRRHNGVYYMWKIEKVDGGYMDSDVRFDSFGNEVVRATDAVYYAATLNEKISFNGISDYRISLIEARNPMQPAQALELFGKVI